MVAWKIFDRKSPEKQQVVTGRFELEQDGAIAYLEYTMSGSVLELNHTEVPEKLRHLGLAAGLAENALKWARENKYKVDIVCPLVEDYIAKHPEYSDLILH